MSHNAAAALFYQQSSEHRKQNEYSLLQKAVEREEYLKLLSNLVYDVNAERRSVDSAYILESFILLNQLRNASFDFSDALELWSLEFVTIIRPQLFGSDYLCEIINKQQILLSLRIRKLFHFRFNPGNILLLPVHFMHSDIISNTSTINIGDILSDTLLLEEMEKFASPPIDRVVKFYKMLWKFLPKKMYEKLFQLEEWASNRWIPPTQSLITNSISSNKRGFNKKFLLVKSKFSIDKRNDDSKTIDINHNLLDNNIFVKSTKTYQNDVIHDDNGIITPSEFDDIHSLPFISNKGDIHGLPRILSRSRMTPLHDDKNENKQLFMSTKQSKMNITTKNPKNLKHIMSTNKIETLRNLSRTNKKNKKIEPTKSNVIINKSLQSEIEKDDDHLYIEELKKKFLRKPN